MPERFIIGALLLSSMNIMVEPNITIVTAFFDIGRGDWTEEGGNPGYLQRTTEKYFKYFKSLSELENPMVIYTSSDFVNEIRKIRQGKETYIREIDFKDKFQICREYVQSILDNQEFRSKINPVQLKNPEYWSADYVLINNLKSYFVKKALIDLNLNNEYFAWVDFGYCRYENVLNHLTEWNFVLDHKKVHFFTLKKSFNLTEENVYHTIFNNQPYIIGGVIVASKDKWFEFAKLVYSTQRKLMDDLIIDDDQGVYLLCLLSSPDLFQLNYLGKNKWFDVFKKYDSRSKLSLGDMFKKIIGRY